MRGREGTQDVTHVNGFGVLSLQAESFWNIAASLWGYYYGELARLGSTAIAASQLTGYPAGVWTIHGSPVNHNFPCVSMMDWRRNGSDTARTWSLQMTIDVLGNDEKKMFAAEVSAPAAPASPWPLKSTVYSIGFERADGKRVVLLSNTNSSATTATLRGASGATIHTVDASAGVGTTPYRTAKLASDVIELAPSAFSLVEL